MNAPATATRIPAPLALHFLVLAALEEGEDVNPPTMEASSAARGLDALLAALVRARGKHETCARPIETDELARAICKGIGRAPCDALRDPRFAALAAGAEALRRCVRIPDAYAAAREAGEVSSEVDAALAVLACYAEGQGPRSELPAWVVALELVQLVALIVDDLEALLAIVLGAVAELEVGR